VVFEATRVADIVSRVFHIAARRDEAQATLAAGDEFAVIVRVRGDGENLRSRIDEYWFVSTRVSRLWLAIDICDGESLKPVPRCRRRRKVQHSDAGLHAESDG
tara:strand:+ start:1674 stop:1982 length:309 start_codon:yes stop_codon:yes gene_type:complete